MTTSAIDRPAAIRRALCALVADRGFHGTSMNAVASEAGVATGTAYVHYSSKEDLVYATYLEIKRELGEAVVTQIDPDASPEIRYRQTWMAAYRHLSGDADRARFMVQLESSPYYETAHRMAMEQGDALAQQAEEFLALTVDLPVEVLYSMSLGSAVRLAAAGTKLTDDQLETLADATWRAIRR